MNRNNPPAHYLIPGRDLELIDVLRAKSGQFTDPWEFFLWASFMQYAFRYRVKGEVVKDLRKANTYLQWLREYLNE